MKGKSRSRNWDQLRDSPGRLQLGGIPLGLLLFDLVLQDGHLGPARDGMGGDPPAEADALLGYTKSVAPERVTLGEGASENSVLGNTLSFTLHHAALCHAYDLFSLNHANRLRIILVINSSMICAVVMPWSLRPHRFLPFPLPYLPGPKSFMIPAGGWPDFRASAMNLMAGPV